MKELNWVKYGFNLAILGLFSVCGMLYAQQNSIIEKQGDQFTEAHKIVKEELSKKVNNKVLSEMIKIIDIKLEHDKELWLDQQVFNEATRKLLQDLNINVILLNEKVTKDLR